MTTITPETWVGKVKKILPGGDALLCSNGESVLLGNGVPGDELAFQPVGKRRGVMHGEVVEILHPSKQRVDAPCPVAAQCGGCALQFISCDGQSAVKSNWISDAFKSLIDDQTEWVPVYANVGRYRRRVRWFVGRENNQSFLGFYAPASHRPVRHTHCMMITTVLNAVRQWIEANVNLSGINSVQAIQLHNGIHIVLETDACPLVIEYEQYEQFDQIGELTLQWWWRDQAGITRPLHKPVQAFHDLLPAGKADIILTVGPDDFVQGQAEGNRELISQIQTWAGSVNRIADLFCGIGNLSLPLAAATGAHVYGAELNPASVRAASKNAKALGLHASFEVGNLFESFDLETYIGADVLILDPPRRGAKRICQNISRLLPKKIIMISCDVAAGARDGALLRQHGYRLKALRGLDLFPYAGHVETMSLWEQ